MFINNRVILKNDAVFTDISMVTADQHDGKSALEIVAAEDALYIGSDAPFNHRFLMLGAKNSIAGITSVAIWGGSSFVSCEDVQDFTVVAGIPFARNGILRWALPDNTGWSRVTDSSQIPELASLKSKAAYWAKLTFSAAFEFELEYIGFRFARDADLGIYYKDLLKPEIMKAFNMGVPMQNWDKVHVAAAEEVIKDLRAEEIVLSANNVLDPETFTDAATHKLAEMAWSQLKNQERLEFAQDKYKAAMAKKVFNVDRNQNGRLEKSETVAAWRLRRV